MNISFFSNKDYSSSSDLVQMGMLKNSDLFDTHIINLWDTTSVISGRVRVGIFGDTDCFKYNVFCGISSLIIILGRICLYEENLEKNAILNCKVLFHFSH